MGGKETDYFESCSHGSVYDRWSLRGDDETNSNKIKRTVFHRYLSVVDKLDEIEDEELEPIENSDTEELITSKQSLVQNPQEDEQDKKEKNIDEEQENDEESGEQNFKEDLATLIPFMLNYLFENYENITIKAIAYFTVLSLDYLKNYIRNEIGKHNWRKIIIENKDDIPSPLPKQTVEENEEPLKKKVKVDSLIHEISIYLPILNLFTKKFPDIVVDTGDRKEGESFSLLDSSLKGQYTLFENGEIVDENSEFWFSNWKDYILYLLSEINFISDEEHEILSSNNNNQTFTHFLLLTAHFIKFIRNKLLPKYSFNEFTFCSDMKQHIEYINSEEIRNELLELREKKWKFKFEIPTTLSTWFTTFNNLENSLEQEKKNDKLTIFLLPIELQHEILTFYSVNKVKDLLQLRLICKEWNNIIISPQRSNQLWLQLCFISIKNSPLYPYVGKDDIYVYGPITLEEKEIIEREKNENLREESTVMYKRTVANRLAGKFTYTLFKDIAMRQQLINHERDLDGFKCWYENIGKHYAKKNDLGSFLLINPLTEENRRYRFPGVCISIFMDIQDEEGYEEEDEELEDEKEEQHLEEKVNRLKKRTKFGGNHNLPLEVKPNNLGSFFGQLDLEQIAGKSMAHGGILPQTGMIYIFIKDAHVDTFAEYAKEVETTLLYVNPTSLTSKEITCSIGVNSNYEYPRGEVCELQNGLAIQYSDSLYPGHYRNWGYWKDYIARYFELAMLSSFNSSYAAFCPPLNVPFEQRNNYYQVVLCQNLENTTALIMVDLTKINELFETGKMVTQSKIIADGCRYYAQNE
ncbi:hypothetical protein ABK040_001225 [Willaertia magna]